MPRLHTPRAPTIGQHNRALAQATARGLKVEERLAAILAPILDGAADEAARAFAARATDHLTAAVPGLTSLSTMVAVKPTPEQAAALAVQEGEDPGTLHVTLAYIGEFDGDLDLIGAALAGVAADHAPLEGEVAGAGWFGGQGVRPAILLPDVPGLVELRVAVTEALARAGIGYSRDHGFEAHLTVAYAGDPAAALADVAGIGSPLTFAEILVVRGNTEIVAVPLVGRPPLTAAAGWSAPAPDELVDAAALVRRLRTKTDPVRRAVVETTMGKALSQVGIDFDATNPFTAKVLAQAGSQVTEIAHTTRANVMRIIREAYEQGLTIPDTATAIRAGMKAATPARARLIARTELVGAVNGGSLAATQIVSQATGIAYQKTWLTAPGADFPRHEDYDGLDGQTTGLDGYFDVGGTSLEFPGDPAGPPDEICNCRCTMIYAEPGEAAAA